MKIDFHIHTKASDGQYAPKEIVKMADQKGIECIAITDHDTLNGLDEAIQTEKDFSVRVIRGIELGAKEHRYLHILGLNLKDNATEIERLCQELVDSRNERKYRIIDYLKEKNINISLDEVEKMAGGKVIARPHFAQVMVNKGYVVNMREAFDKYLDTEEYQKIERKKASAQECIEAIHAAGGRAFMAHPYQLQYSDDKLEKMVSELKIIGLDGLECYYSLHTKKQTEFYLYLSRKYDMLVSAGSDFHGEKVKPNIEMGGMDIEVPWLV